MPFCRSYAVYIDDRKIEKLQKINFFSFDLVMRLSKLWSDVSF